MALLKGKEMVFEAFESGIFLKSEQSKQSKQSNQSSSDDKYTSSSLDNASNNNFSSDSYISSFMPKKVTRLKILTPKQMLERLPIALAKVKADGNSESLLNEIRQIVYSL